MASHEHKFSTWNEFAAWLSSVVKKMELTIRQIVENGTISSNDNSFLIPGLPNDTSLSCIAHITVVDQYRLRLVSRNWFKFLSSGELYKVSLKWFMFQPSSHLCPFT